MRTTPPPTGLEKVSDPVVRAAIDALARRDRDHWYELFRDGAEFSDDGIARDLKEWCDEELFGSALAYLISIDRSERGGLTFYARYHSDKWGDFKTFWKFAVEGGKILRLDVGATSY